MSTRRAAFFQTPGRTPDRPPSFRALLGRVAAMDPVIRDEYGEWSCLFCRMVFPPKPEDRTPATHLGHCLWMETRRYLRVPVD